MDPNREPFSGSPAAPAVFPAPTYLSGEPQPSTSWSYHTATAYYHQPTDHPIPPDHPYHPPPAFSPGPMGSWMSTAPSVQQQYASQDLDDAASYPAMTEDTQDSLPPSVGEDGDEPEEDAVPEKPLADLACQRFRRVKKPTEGDKQKKAKLVRRGRGNAARWGDMERAEEEDVGSVTSEVRTVSEARAASEELENELAEAVDSAAAEEEPEEVGPVDETEEAEAEEFFSQLIDLGEDEEDGENRAAPAAKLIVARRGNLRWTEDECELLRACCRLLESDYCTIQELLPHRSIAEIKKQYDRQRALYPSLLAHWAMSPRYHSVQEYHKLRAELEQQRAAFEKEMVERGVRPWADGETPVGKRGRKRKTA